MPRGEETIFSEAVRLPPEDQATFLENATKDDGALRHRIQTLLKGYQAAEFLENAAPGCPGPDVPSVSLKEKTGDRIGRYKLLQQIGEGGCGIVYMAEQEEPVRRRVALKIIKLGMDTASVIARFEAERQALALMDHPHIAKVLDAGATDTGRPYFVMELVRGIKITDYCDEKKLPTRERLALFVSVCQAVQHAHQKGIIHRDLKPSNILVTVNDGVAVPKVIDFGIAKATGGQQLTDKTLFTAFEQFIGTPAYMSPEQAIMTSLDVDTRSDIYALGVLLYELLTGRTPFDAERLLAAGLDEMRRTIRETEPDRPSTRLSTLPGAELSTTAQRRGLDAPKLVSELRGDLDWIVMKSLEKDRARRYETANGLAMDVQRHLNNEPVSACPPSTLYRLRKTVRRHRLVFAAGAIVVVALATGLGLSTWMLKRAVAAEKAERKLREEAELRELKLTALQARFQNDNKTAAKTMRTILERQRRILGNDAKEVGDSLVELSVFLQAEHDYAEAEQALNQAVDLFRKQGSRGALGSALGQLASLLVRQDKKAQAEDRFREAIQLYRDKDDRRALAGTLNNLGALIGDQGRYAEAESLFREGYEIQRKLFGDGHPEVANSAENLLHAAYNLGNMMEVEDLTRTIVGPNINAQAKLKAALDEIAERLLQDYGYNRAEKLLSDLLSQAPNNWDLLSSRGAFRAMHGHWRSAYEDYVRLVELKPDNAFDWDKLARILYTMGEADEYRAVCRKAMARFADSSETPYHQIARVSLLVRWPDSDLEILGRMADRSVVPYSTNYAKTSYFTTKALADYRRGRFAPAADLADKVLSSGFASHVPALEVEVRSILALARHRLNEPELARSALTKAKAVADKNLALLPKGELGGRWHDWIIAQAVLREATDLIEPSPAAKSGVK